MFRLAVALVLSWLMLVPFAARADEACSAGMAEMGGARVIRAALNPGEVQISYIGHSTFVLESPKGITAATDYNDYIRPMTPPVIATMNRAHDTHFSRHPDPKIAHVLRGWSDAMARARHDVVVDDMRVRNVPTNIRLGADTEYYGNSIFVFEVSGLCIGHLGHLHHTLTPEHLKAIGQLDVALVPVDGSYTLDPEGMSEVINQLQAKVMIPMHYFGSSTLNRFLEKVADRYRIERMPISSLTLSRATLPQKPTVMVLPPQPY